MYNKVKTGDLVYSETSNAVGYVLKANTAVAWRDEVSKEKVHFEKVHFIKWISGYCPQYVNESFFNMKINNKQWKLIQGKIC